MVDALESSSSVPRHHDESRKELEDLLAKVQVVASFPKKLLAAMSAAIEERASAKRRRRS